MDFRCLKIKKKDILSIYFALFHMSSSERKCSVRFLESVVQSDAVLKAVLECIHNFNRDDFMCYLDYMINKPSTEKPPWTTACEEQLKLYRRLYKYIDDKVDDLLKEEEDEQLRDAVIFHDLRYDLRYDDIST